MVARVRCASMKFRKLSLILTFKRASATSLELKEVKSMGARFEAA